MSRDRVGKSGPTAVCTITSYFGTRGIDPSRRIPSVRAPAEERESANSAQLTMSAGGLNRAQTSRQGRESNGNRTAAQQRGAGSFATEAHLQTSRHFFCTVVQSPWGAY
ncbi:unnamed protein product [Ectocarpus fasciculatus]